MKLPSLPPPRHWHPRGTRHTYDRPEAGDLVAVDHAVWRVTSVGDIPLHDDADREAWLAAGMPDLTTWRRRPYAVNVTHVGGKPPRRPGKDGQYGMRIPADDLRSWEVYPRGRWPQCSCCGEPMPCRAELADEHVEYAEEQVSEFEARMPGCCWSCNEPITQRQRAVVYPGINLDLPTGPEPRFHLRAKCRYAAERYEERWLAAAGEVPRKRVLTYPKCPGRCIVHADGSSQCHGGHDDCHGHDTYNHGHFVACFHNGGPIMPNPWGEGGTCPRGCSREDHHGAGRLRPRPPRDSDQLS